MKTIQCDGCPRTTPSDTLYGNPPSGWITVGQRGQEDQHFCSSSCAVVAMTEHLTITQRPLLREVK